MWRSDFKRKVPFFAACPDYISIETKEGERIARVPIPDQENGLEIARIRASMIVSSVNKACFGIPVEKTCEEVYKAGEMVQQYIKNSNLFSGPEDVR